MSLAKLGAMSVRDFFARFPDEEACLNHIMEVRFGTRSECPKCKVYGTFHKLNERRAFSCAACGHHIYPTAGTIFQDTRTPLQVWFYAIYLFVTTRHGVSGKELQRTLGVTYKTAWRIGQQIRKLMSKANNFDALQGHVEVDESYVGGYQTLKDWRKEGSNKTIVMGLAERGGPMMAKVIPDVKMQTLRDVVVKNVKPGSRDLTDELYSYGLLELNGYEHGSVNHRKKEYARGDVHTNSIEGFWRLFKNSVQSTHIHVSPKYMDRYLSEFTFRSNHRQMQNAMFDLLIEAV